MYIRTLFLAGFGIATSDMESSGVETIPSRTDPHMGAGHNHSVRSPDRISSISIESGVLLQSRVPTMRRVNKAAWRCSSQKDPQQNEHSTMIPDFSKFDPKQEI
jgi:hypothetical protein